MTYDPFVYREATEQSGGNDLTEEQAKFITGIMRTMLETVKAEPFRDLEEDAVQMVLVGPPEENMLPPGMALNVVAMMAFSIFGAARIQKYIQDTGAVPTSVALSVELVFNEPGENFDAGQED